MRRNKIYNGYRTDHLRYCYIGFLCDDLGRKTKIDRAMIYNSLLWGFVYDFDLKYQTKKDAFRYSISALKNISFIKRLKHA